MTRREDYKQAPYEKNWQQDDIRQIRKVLWNWDCARGANDQAGMERWRTSLKGLLRWRDLATKKLLLEVLDECVQQHRGTLVEAFTESTVRKHDEKPDDFID